ncbi:MAG: NADH-quinone oxidoreductase subunit C [Candidatus Firestonebacteria bacterium]
MDNLELLSKITGKFPEVKEFLPAAGVLKDEMLAVSAPAGVILPLCTELKNNKDFDFDYVMCISGVDLKDKLQAVYHLYSLKRKHKLEIKTELDAVKPEVDSVSSLWQGADWHEREAYDMFGIVFKGHPNLTRILTAEDFEGYPLRKDYEGKPDNYD